MDGSEIPVHVERIIRAFGSEHTTGACAYIYDLDGLHAHVSKMVATLPPWCKLFYAVKANCEAPILRTLLPLVHGFEAASLGEIEKVRALDNHVPILFGGPGKTFEEIRAAILHRIDLLHVESIHELRLVDYIAGQIGTRVKILLRVNLRGPLCSATLRMGGAATQFGIDESEVGEAVGFAHASAHLDLQGFHFHSLSNNLSAQDHARLINIYLERTRSWENAFNVNLRYINGGGGIGVNYADTTQQFDWTRFTSGLNQLCTPSGSPAWTLLLECGRYLVASCGYYAVEVLDIKQNHGEYFAIVRGGSHHFRLPVSWQHSHPFIIIPMERWAYPFKRPELHARKVTIAGQLCTPKDVLARDIFVPRIRAGDVVLFSYAGAYGWHISHHDFLSHPYPEMIFAEADRNRVSIQPVASVLPSFP